MDWSVEWDGGHEVVVGWALIASLVWPVIVEVPGVLVEDLRGAAFVVDEDSVGALGPDAADEPFGVAVSLAGGVRGGILTCGCPKLGSRRGSWLASAASTRPRTTRATGCPRRARPTVRLNHARQRLPDPSRR